MIAGAYLNEWVSQAPWPTQLQVEQDLVLSRLIVEIARHELLGGELAFRGGTCLHKLHLAKPLRYSEDLDYVRCTRSGIKPYLAALRDVAGGVGLVEHGTTQLAGAPDLSEIERGRWRADDVASVPRTGARGANRGADWAKLAGAPERKAR